ncbi:hypothetical protein MESS2_730105 [Mesorhizobium metallidurans STM 2683]|uniref:Uncharacterized protein n=1 Tax=Mesorhizobium metallidurans STM 2683 TaxID=1297569 RepID=M5ETB4_9HYPH|nr:hypothetical protein MESS2_730105 [Mesorhizobium metallidurans STM 2683]
MSSFLLFADRASRDCFNGVNILCCGAPWFSYSRLWGHDLREEGFPLAWRSGRLEVW